MTTTLATGAEGLEIRWADGTCGIFPYIWLRDTDPAGFHPQTGERTFDLTAVPLDIAPTHATIQGDRLQLTWPGAETPSSFALDWIRANRPGSPRHDPADIPLLAWRADLGAQGVPRHEAAAITGSDAGLADWLVDTRRYGLSIVTGLADTTDAGIEVARRVGHLRETNFGLTFEVMSKPDPNNLAYTSDALPLHTDLTNQELPPGYQFLHCLANEAEGGGSTFCDGLAVARDLQGRDPEAFEILSRVTVPFRFQDRDTDIRSRKAVITLDGRGHISEVCFNAHLADILDIDAATMPGFYRAYRMFMQMTRDPAYGIALRLGAGEMVVFDNRRVMHGREAFDPATGFRHLHGCYVDRGEWDSRIRVLARDMA
ncbi:TauD/TfdA family dioxygenase [Paracoccus sp. 1_MG-2023]|uniref:TauD/TfdA family dioxygenase n=1 Tax=unclassified Paracoccus (in: a-proteobacteria) TaxID=2688777 RepID=UPI001C095956|nr:MULTISPECIES: TauD/TfdA family dioxygenase [unclassified Paracoccus (in: a-proteobacteria)]MBU2957909.1 TauD/TfdA family dioxygenase [Paracoccus sp. C2R09]MDO6668898.1 TauD/TfdA family dioxygenase [Paracoccus sp. 1_MG-2023]